MCTLRGTQRAHNELRQRQQQKIVFCTMDFLVWSREKQLEVQNGQKKKTKKNN